ncbi:MAG TPA: hypothetical protein VHX42_00050 [Candidatus Babeliales bacterium]|jgi:hypothetical protein|nr:hypothetical protein [Candidatus Babeliales bacterium]
MKKISLCALALITNGMFCMQHDVAESLIAQYVDHNGKVTGPIQRLVTLTDIQSDLTITHVAHQTKEKWFNSQWDHSHNNGFNDDILQTILTTKKKLNISSIGQEQSSHIIGHNGVPPSCLKFLLAVDQAHQKNNLEKVTVFSCTNCELIQSYEKKDYDNLAQLLGKTLPDNFICPENPREVTECLRHHLFTDLKNILFEYVEYDKSSHDAIKNWAAANKNSRVMVVASSGQLTSHLLKFHLFLEPNAIEIVSGHSLQDDEYPEIEELYIDTMNDEQKANFALNDLSRTLMGISEIKSQQ